MNPSFRCLRVVVAGLIALQATPSLAAAETPDGQKIYEQACSKCHNAGPGAFFTGAPKLGTASWPMRLQKAGSIEELISITARGKGKMPAQGGASGLNEADLKAAVEYILSKSPSQ